MSSSQPSRTEQDSELIGLLRARGRRVTPQRLVILRELRRLGGHVAAERVHDAAARDLPGTSVPTVYATLELLVELGLARKLDIGRGFSLYEARTEPHEHAVCDRCGDVTDLDAAVDAGRLIDLAETSGFRSERVQTMVFGLCAGCAHSKP